MSNSGRTQVVDVTYDDPRTGQRVYERKIQEVPYEEIEQIRGQELALFRSPDARARADWRDERDRYGNRAYDDYHAIARPRPQDRLAPPDDRYDDRRDYRSTDRHRHRRRDEDRDRSRRRPEDGYSGSDSESSRERRRRRRHRRAKSEQGSTRDQMNGETEGDDDNGRLWYSGRLRKDAKWHERHFDSSYDGIIAAAAGAALGGITARSFGGDKNAKWKIAGGALVGAAALNSAENHYRLYTEEKEEEREKQGKRRKADDVQLDKPVLLGGQMVAGGLLPGM